LKSSLSPFPASHTRRSQRAYQTTRAARPDSSGHDTQDLQLQGGAAGHTALVSIPETRVKKRLPTPLCSSFSLSQPVVVHGPPRKARRHTAFQRLRHIWPATARVHQRGARSQYVGGRERNGYPPAPIVYKCMAVISAHLYVCSLRPRTC